ncbi:uncharacterized protein LOC121374232 isoform X4 [Gigantopelta aegis]|uniref:uncharacterized protein LOC121374232 isoform X4 n=1 Tax=Gigantopelta aegis TaxID=1735272 RepID=UPI001B88C160|nr:uncharacterized protein LOC121374232 isoform X4 [Gigantopelta aegis]
MKRPTSYLSMVKNYDCHDTSTSYVPVVALEYNVEPESALGCLSCPTITSTPSTKKPSSYLSRQCHSKRRNMEDDLSTVHKVQGVAFGQKSPVTSRFGFNSSSTPTVPYTAADLAYSDVNKQAGDLTTTDLVCFDREKEKNKFREFDASNRQHSGKNNSRRSISLEKVNFDNDKDELRPIKNTFSTNKQNQGRPNGLRGNFIRTDQLLNPKNNVSFQSVGREPEDLIAMGTIWSPNVQQRSSTTTTASTKSLALPPSYNTLAAQPIRKGPNGLTARPLLGSQNQSTSKKEVEPRYSDPLTGAPASFQQRLIELSSLESETIRWERTKKIKKKSKADRDS